MRYLKFWTIAYLNVRPKTSINILFASFLHLGVICSILVNMLMDTLDKTWPWSMDTIHKHVIPWILLTIDGELHVIWVASKHVMNTRSIKLYDIIIALLSVPIPQALMCNGFKNNWAVPIIVKKLTLPCNMTTLLSLSWNYPCHATLHGLNPLWRPLCTSSLFKSLRWPTKISTIASSWLLSGKGSHCWATRRCLRASSSIATTQERDSMGKVMVWAVREVLGSLMDFLKGDKAFMELLPKPLVSYKGGISVLWFISRAPSKPLARVSPLKMFLLEGIKMKFNFYLFFTWSSLKRW